jgi:hypothetical protein
MSATADNRPAAQHGKHAPQRGEQDERTRAGPRGQQPKARPRRQHVEQPGVEQLQQPQAVARRAEPSSRRQDERWPAQELNQQDGEPLPATHPEILDRTGG